MNNGRLRSSFIYLANAVNDLRGNWLVLAAVLAPLVIVTSLCALPNALNHWNEIAGAFEPGTQSVEYAPVQTPYAPPRNVPPARQPYPRWLTTALSIVIVVVVFALVKLPVLCLLARIQAGQREPGVLNEAIAAYRKTISLAPAWAWIAFLQWIVPVVALFPLVMFFLGINFETSSAGAFLAFAITRAAMVIVGTVVYLWLYFAQYALVFDNAHSFHALLLSRDQIRKRFFRVATRIAVFLAVGSGFNSWAITVAAVVSRLIGPVVAITGFVALTIFLLDLMFFAVILATSAFIAAAGLRLYQDLKATLGEHVTAGNDVGPELDGGPQRAVDEVISPRPRVSTPS